MKCSFCGKNIKEGTGIMFVNKVGKIYYFCSKKCEKSMIKFKRKSADRKWSKR